jgi:hypothetical protein
MMLRVTIAEANALAQLYYKGQKEFVRDGPVWTMERVTKIKERKGWRKVLEVTCGEERVYLDLA